MKTKVIFKAKTNSEWDSCDLAIVDLAVMSEDQLSQRIAMVKQAAEDSDFSSLSFWFWGTDFFTDTVLTGGKFLSERFLPKNSDWNFIADLDVEFDPPQSQLNGFEIIFTKTGAYFAADGKHTDDRYWTEEIPVAVLEQYIIDRKSEGDSGGQQITQ